MRRGQVIHHRTWCLIFLPQGLVYIVQRIHKTLFFVSQCIGQKLFSSQDPLTNSDLQQTFRLKLSGNKKIIFERDANHSKCTFNLIDAKIFWSCICQITRLKAIYTTSFPPKTVRPPTFPHIAKVWATCHPMIIAKTLFGLFGCYLKIMTKRMHYI